MIKYTGTLTVTQNDSNISHCRKSQICRQNISTLSVILVPEPISTSGLGGHIAISGCLTLSQSFGATFLELVIIVVNDHVICFST